VLEAPDRPERVGHRDPVLLEHEERVEERLEVGLADERRAVPRVVPEVRGHAGRIDGQRHAVHPDAVVVHVLAGDHGGSGRHAHDVRRVRALVADAARGDRVDHRGPGDATAVAAQAVVALLVGGDEEDPASHGHFPSTRSRRLWMARPVT
jgi:hypothetical protein